MRKTTLMTALAASVIGAVATAMPADALTRNCNSSTARMCIHYNSVANGMNSEFGSDYSVPSFNPSNTSNDIYFKAGTKGSAGAGSWVWNNAASLVNYHPDVRVGVFETSNYGGLVDVFGANRYGNLVNTKNNNASMGWGY